MYFSGRGKGLNSGMQYFLRTFLLSVWVMSAHSVSGQTLADLEALSDAVWSVSLAPGEDLERFDTAAQRTLPEIVFEDRTESALLEDWAGPARKHVGSIQRYSPLDGIECTVLDAEGISRFNRLVAERGEDAWDDLPKPLRALLVDEIIAVMRQDIVSLRTCIGVWHPRTDRVDYPVWTLWYDKLEQQFEDAGLTVSRSSSTASSYPAGFLSSKGRYCQGKSCILQALLWSVAIPGGNSNQTTLSTLSIRLR